MTSVTRRERRVVRCWESNDPAYNAYHDEEWGRPVRDERGLLRAALPRGLPVRAVVADDPAQARELPRRVRAVRPGDASPASASATSSGCSATRASSATAARSRPRSRTRARRSRCARRARRSHELVWEYRRDGPAPATWDAQTPASVELSKRLRKAGFRFVGPTTVYAAMQACGIVNDHRRDVLRPRCGRTRAPLMLDDRVRAVLARLEEEDRRERDEGVARELRARQVAPTTGQFLFALVAPQTDCEVLEIGGSRGYSTIWLAAGVRHLGGRVLSLEHDPRKCEAWRAEHRRGGARRVGGARRGRRVRERCPRSTTSSTSSSSTPRRTTTSGCSQLARDKVEPGALFVADNVLSHEDDPRRVLPRPAGRPDARVRDRPARPRSGAVRRPPLVPL